MTEHSFALIPASYVYLVRDEQVLLQRRQNTGYMDGHWVAGAAGHVEAAESAREAAVREAYEELGVRIDAEDLELITVMQRRNGDAVIEQRVDWFWTVRRWSGDPVVQEPHKASALEWFPLTELPEPMPDYERHVVRGIDDTTFPRATSSGFATDA